MILAQFNWFRFLGKLIGLDFNWFRLELNWLRLELNGGGDELVSSLKDSLLILQPLILKF